MQYKMRDRINREEMKEVLIQLAFPELHKAAYPLTAYTDGSLYDVEGRLIWDKHRKSKRWLAEWVNAEGVEV